MRALSAVGMDDTESKVYLFLLGNNASSQQTISDKTGILRQTVYDIMKKMETKGYVSITKVGKRKHYSAVPPKLLLSMLKEKEEQFLQALPELEKMSQGEQVSISSETFLGLEGLKNLFNLTLESTSEILWIANKSLYDERFQGYYWHNYAKKRIDRKIPIKLLIEPSKAKDWNTDKKVWRETRRSKLVEGLSSSFVIFDTDKVIVYSLEKGQLFGVFIQNKATKESCEKMFWEFWKSAR